MSHQRRFEVQATYSSIGALDATKETKNVSAILLILFIAVLLVAHKLMLQRFGSPYR